MSDNTEDKQLEQLIENLGEDLKPVSCLGCASHRAGGWFIAGLFSVVMIGALIGFRMDLPEKLLNGVFSAEILAALILSWSAAYASAWLALPDGANKKRTILLPYAVISVATLILLVELFYHEFVVGDFEIHHCVIDATIMGCVPLFMMIWMMRRGAPTHPVLGAMTNMIAAGAIGYVGLR
ncbi:MAG: DUF1109 family protein [Rhodospirillales bacterium]|nr:DUF1109 family protein [Rhodospirillales bacterium]